MSCLRSRATFKFSLNFSPKVITSSICFDYIYASQTCQ
nr:MAG TPA: hypothetical protein [Caudoviricetes sp.]